MKMKKMLAQILSCVFLITLLPTTALAVEDGDTAYDLWVGGVEVTAENAADVLGEADEGATVAYDPDTATLTLNGAVIIGGLEYRENRFAGIYAKGDLNIELGAADSSVTAPDGKRSYGIYVNGNLNISGSGSLTAIGGNADGGTDADGQSIGIFVPGVLTMNDGILTAAGSTAAGTTALSGGIYVADLIQTAGRLTASGETANAGESGLAICAGVYTQGVLELDYTANLTAIAGSAKGFYAQSMGVFTTGTYNDEGYLAGGDLTVYSGNLTAAGGSSCATDAEGAYATSAGIFTQGYYSMWGGSVTATGDAAKGPDAYSAGVCTKAGLDLHDGSLTAAGGAAEGGYALSTGIEIASVTGEEYLNLNVYGGSLNAAGGNAVGIGEADSTGIYAEYSGVYICGDDHINLTAGNAMVTAENAYAASNGIYAEAGDVEINAGDVTITGGIWEGANGDGWAIYAEADVEYDESGAVESVSGGNVTIDCTEAATTSSHSHGFTGTRVTLTGVDDKNGYAIYAGSSITIGDAMTISEPKGAVIHEIKEGWYGGAIILENGTDGAPLAKSVTIVNVSADAYYYDDAVLWAAENGITGGTTAATFSPDDPCTRAQTVTFLWRAAGCPAPETTVNPFVDVAEGAYYYDAVLWAVENGITNGTTATTFSPNATVTRAQAATFLWRWAEEPAAETVNPFVDVADSAYYHDAVIWAVDEGITGGTSATTFSPNDPCTCAQMVTFLYRHFGNK